MMEIEETPEEPAVTVSDLSPELIASILSQCSGVRDLLNALQTCHSWLDIGTRSYPAVVCSELLQRPHLAEYDKSSWQHGTAEFLSHPLPPPPPWPQRVKAACMQRRDWHSGFQAPDENTTRSFPSYVRSMVMDWESRRMFVGTYDGTVFKQTWGVDSIENLTPKHAEGQCIALDWHASGLGVSGSGMPSYLNTSCPGATMHVWQLAPPRGAAAAPHSGRSAIHVLGPQHGGHTNSITAVKIVEPGAGIAEREGAEGEARGRAAQPVPRRQRSTVATSLPPRSGSWRPPPSSRRS